jgi:Arrestin (or S-antigen), C-terminal domain/Arrestin (or S-antigen), N-terminal domain
LTLKGRAQFNTVDRRFLFEKKQSLCRISQQFIGSTALHPAGHFSFEFSLKIPENVPSSMIKSIDDCAWCDANRALIEYELALVLDIPGHLDIYTKKQIEIVRMEDLNLVPSIRDCVPFTTDERLEVVQSLKSRGSMRIKVTLPYGGFVSGRKMPILIWTKNESDKEFKKMKISFKETVASIDDDAVKVFRAFTQTLDKKKVKLNEIERLSRNLFEFSIPDDIHLSNGSFCDAVKVFHKLIVTLYPKGSFVDLVTVEVPVIIGNISVRLSDEEQRKIDEIFSKDSEEK